MLQTCDQKCVARKAPRCIFRPPNGQPKIKNVWFSIGNTMILVQEPIQKHHPGGRSLRAGKVLYAYYSLYDLIISKLCKLERLLPARDPPSHRPPETIKCTSETRFTFLYKNKWGPDLPCSREGGSAVSRAGKGSAWCSRVPQRVCAKPYYCLCRGDSDQKHVESEI